MGKKITGAEHPLFKIFSSEFDYHIPPYQRPYAWRREETGTLFDDLYDFYKNEKQDENYFLGSIVLIKDDDKAYAEVIDGQQRLTTLTILIAAITSKFTEDTKKDFLEYILEPGRPSQGLKPRPRLHLRQKDALFFENYIQNLQFKQLEELKSETLPNEAQKHIKENSKVILDKISEKFKDEEALLKFGQFLVQRCYIVAVSTPSQASAFRVFSVMNSRGLDLLPIDLIKADIIGKISEDERATYTDKWEALEMQTTRDGFNEVFAHIRTIYAKVKAKKSLLEEFKSYVLKNVTPKQLIEKVLEPYSTAYSTLKKQNFIAEEHSEEINNYLMWLNKIDNSDWMPMAIKFFAEHDNHTDYILWFVKKLERLAAFLHVTAKDINKRIERYSEVLTEMEVRKDHTKNNPLKSLELTNQEKVEFLATLKGCIYYLTPRRRNYVILRLDSFVSDGAATYNPSVLTIEHVLPQTVAPGSEWEKVWIDTKTREKYLHCIGNLVPLTRYHNSAAQNYEFDKKKSIYFTNKNGTTSYSLTTQVINEKVWTPEVVKSRQEKLIDMFKTKWEL